MSFSKQNFASLYYKQFIFPIFAIIIGLLLLVPVPALAQSDENDITIHSQVGFDGYFKGEHWVPVQIEVANSGPAIEGELRVTVENSTFGQDIDYVAPISLPTQSSKRVTIYISMPRVIQPTVALYKDNGTLVASATVNKLSQLPLDGLLYGVVSPDPGEFSFLENVSVGHSAVGVAFLELSELPETAVAWQALDILLINDVDTAELSQAQIDALEAWVDIGGQLIVTGGGSWQKTTAGLADLLPVTLTGSESRDDLPALTQAVGIPFRDPGPYLVTTSELRKGAVLYHQDGLPLLAEQPLGEGAVYFLALDPKLAPMLDWDGSELMVAKIAVQVPSRPPWALPVQNAYAAESAVSSLPALSLPSVWQLIIFLLIYIILIGPVNYIVLKRRKQLERAWLTIPVFIVLFSAGAYITGFQLRGNDVLINQMSIVYNHAGAEQAQVQSLLGLYSPDRSQYDLQLPPQSVIRPFQETFGPGSGNSNFESISYSNRVTVKGIRVDISGVETFVAQTVQPALAVTGQAALEARDGRLLLTATIQNNSNIDLELTTLLLGDTVVRVGDIKAGAIATVSEVIGTAPTGQSGTFGVGTAVFPVSGGSSPLTANVSTIVDSYDYYNDPVAYPRYQLLQALEGSSGPGSTLGTYPDDAVTLLAWSDEQQIAVELADHDFETSGETLFFIELPLTQNLVSGSDVTVPATLLSWDVLTQGSVYNPSITDLSLNGSWIEFEFVPWAEFQTMDVVGLGINLQSSNTAELAPAVQLWNWQAERWQAVENAGWGETAVSDPTPFIGTQNSIRLRLDDNTSYGVYIDIVHPILTLNQQ
ncbi:MAG: hypothetical protein GY943_18375 [Chloroflexi bacterium]|nr:hypothetical protein [Chloroflexota bacterium]